MISQGGKTRGGPHNRWELPDNYHFFLQNMAIYPSVWIIMHNSRYPQFYNILYTYTLIKILYLGDPSGNTIRNNHGTFIYICMHGYYHICEKKVTQTFIFCQ